jgi:hypothetical protein
LEESKTGVSSDLRTPPLTTRLEVLDDITIPASVNPDLNSPFFRRVKDWEVFNNVIVNP